MCMRREGIRNPVKTTVTLARDLWEETQIAAIRRGLTFTEVVQRALVKYLEILETEKKST